jgi:hypothetical protein
LVFLAFACRQPASVEQFIAAPGPYAFALDLSDSTAVWDISLFSRVDALDAPAELALDVTWTAPSEAVFTETVYLLLQAGTSFFSHEACVPYRSGVAPSERGVWALTVTPVEPPTGLRGVGGVTKRQ